MACATLRPSEEDPINRAGSRLICSELYPSAPCHDRSTDVVPQPSRDASDGKAKDLSWIPIGNLRSGSHCANANSRRFALDYRRRFVRSNHSGRLGQRAAQSSACGHAALYLKTHGDGWNGRSDSILCSFVDRLVMQAHDLVGLQRGHRIRATVIIAELDFVGTRLQVLDHSADLAADQAVLRQVLPSAAFTLFHSTGSCEPPPPT